MENKAAEATQNKDARMVISDNGGECKADLGKAVSHLNKETARGSHAHTVGGHSMENH